MDLPFRPEPRINQRPLLKWFGPLVAFEVQQARCFLKITTMLKHRIGAEPGVTRLSLKRRGIGTEHIEEVGLVLTRWWPTTLSLPGRRQNSSSPRDPASVQPWCSRIRPSSPHPRRCLRADTPGVRRRPDCVARDNPCWIDIGVKGSCRIEQDVALVWGNLRDLRQVALHECIGLVHGVTGRRRGGIIV